MKVCASRVALVLIGREAYCVAVYAISSPSVDVCIFQASFYLGNLLLTIYSPRLHKFHLAMSFFVIFSVYIEHAR
jgi:hypothetical protein